MAAAPTEGAPTMDKFTTDRETDARTARRARGESFSTDNYPPRMVEPPPTRVCATCGADITHRRRQTRFCCPTCCARAHDERAGRTSHVATGKRPRRRALEV